MNKLKGKNILIGVTGGIAIYKVLDLISRLIKAEANVKVIMTDAAMKFVTPLTFETISKNEVYNEIFKNTINHKVEHIELSKFPDAFLIAPATGNTMAKIANGIADNLLTSVALATQKKIIFAPAMNTNMLNNYHTQENMKKLKELGHYFVESDYGLLACGDIGSGRMAEPLQLLEYLNDYFTEKDLLGKKLTITAGPTEQKLDPVRYMTNRSTGKMGYAIAKEAKSRGAYVRLISGPTAIEVPIVDEFIRIETTEDMYNAVEKVFDDTDCLIKSAAPLDYKPVNVSDIKIKKGSSDSNLVLEFERTIDIAETIGSKKGNKIMVGFAAETNDVINYAKDKMIRKNFDFVVANDVSQSDAGFGVDTNRVSIVDNGGNVEELPLMTKNEVANKILDRVEQLLKAR
ncbi:MAG: bifunctional phosphopantothenoylcysteine decarboxylase/phosphopantothenate--cysteine ligase CoaBC [Tissierellia bacterium]|nr:bifunctional phosphopantothenoylcysteine decarboxylase/phosphopantothenate--cysteine ligase CoaBC [Tissierellia bacterium]